MKWLKTAAKCVSNLNAKALKANKILGRAGMSLAELMVVVGISSTIMLGAGSVMVFVADSFVKIIDKDEAEGNLTRAAYALRTIATQAVGLYVVNVNVATGEGIGNTGEAGALESTNLYQGQIVHTVNTQANFPVGTGVDANRGRVVEIAQFHRESSKTTAAGDSFFLPTAIYFKTPWDTCPPHGNNSVAPGSIQAGTRDLCSGQLIIVWNTEGLNNDLAGAITVPDAAGHQRAAFPVGNIQTQVFDRFTRLTVDTSGVNGVGAAGVNSYARDARFRLTARYFLGRAQETWNYDPDDNSHMAKEISMEVYVGFRNNYQGRSQLTNNEPERLHGSPYYFPFISSLQVWL
jgi:hypothetical protein